MSRVNLQGYDMRKRCVTAIMLLLSSQGLFSNAFAQVAAKQQATHPLVAHLTVDPPRLEDCKVVKVVKVEWDVPPGTNIKEVSIFVSGPKDPEKLFTNGGLKGSAETGPWAHAGMKLVLREKDKPRILAQTSIGTAKPCS